MHKLWYVLGGIALLRLTDDRKGIGKIVDGKPDGVTPCLDGKFSTNIPGPGVCSYHAGWRGLQKLEKQPTEVLVRDLDKTIDGITADDIEAHRRYLVKMYTDITNGRSPAELQKINEFWERFLQQYTGHKNIAIRRRARTIGREKATTTEGKAARSALNMAIRSFEKSEQIFMKVLAFNAGIPLNDDAYRAMLKRRTDASLKREDGTYWGNTPADFTPRVTGIGLIVDGKPPGVTPCLDGKFSTHLPGPGVCSYHAGWKGGKKPKQSLQIIAPKETSPAPAPAPAKPKPALQIIAPKAASPAPAAAPYIPPRDRKPPERPETGPNETAIRVYGGWKIVQLPVPPAGVYIEDITYEEGKRAHSGTSLSPDKRGEQEVIGHRQELINTWEFLAKGRSPEQLAALRLRWPSFVQKYTKLKRETLGRRSRVMSTMVTGPANFPTRSNEKKSNAYENKGKEMYAFKDRFEKSIRSDREIYPELMMTEPIKSGEANALQELQEKHRKLVKFHEQMVAANRIFRAKKDIPEKLANAGFSPASIKTLLQHIRPGERAFMAYELTNSNANIRRLSDRIKLEKQVIATREQGEKEKAFAGGQIREDHGDNRLRIFFDSIPDNELRGKLKKSGWKWSPKNQAWQRQLTPNAWSSARHILPII